MRPKIWPTGKEHGIRKVERIKLLLDDIKANYSKGIGKPELLRRQKSGLWSRRIDRGHRLVYSVENDTVTVYACRFHYERQLLSARGTSNDVH